MKTLSMASRKLILALLLVAMLAGEGICARYYVRTSGNDNNAGTSRNSAFRTISHAISVANGYDTIYVGAGKYTERAVQSRTTASRFIQVIGDVTGSRTGDKGEVIVQSSPSQYSIYFYGGRAVFIQDITFTSQRPDAPGSGIYADGPSSYVYVYRCQFKDLQTCVYARNSGYVYGYRSEFSDSTRGIYALSSKIALSYDCNYANCWTAFESSNCESTLGYYGRITNGLDMNGNPSGYMGFRASTGNITVYGTSIENARYGIYAPDIDSGAFAGVSIKNPTSYGIYAKADRITASNISVEGLDQRGWGIRLLAQKNPPTLQSVKCKNLYGGIYAGDTASSYKTSTVLNNRFGLYIPASATNYIDKDLSGISISGNTYGIYSARATNGKYTSLANAKLDKNLYGIAGYGDVELSKCEITNSRYGIRLYEGKATSITDCTVVGDADETNPSEGIYVAADAITVTDTFSKTFRTGLRLNLTSSTSPKLRNIELTDNAVHGLYINGGIVNLSKQNNLVIDGSTYGVYCARSDVTVDNYVPTNSSYPLTFIYGSASVRNATVDKALYGIRSYYQDSFSLSNVTSSSCEYGGAYIYEAQTVRVSKSRFSDGLRHGILIYNPVDIVVADVIASGNKNHGLYLTAASQPKRAEIHDCTLQNNYYGLYTNRIAINPDAVTGLTVSGCRYGVRAVNSDLTVSDRSQWKLDDNYYAISSYQGSLVCTNFELANNDVNLLTQYSPAKITNSKLSSRHINVLLYSGNSSIADCTFDSGRYGIYFAPRSFGDDLSINNAEVTNASSIAVLAYGDRAANVPQVKIEGLKVDKPGYGLYGYYSTLDASNIQVSSPTSYGIYQNRGSLTASDVRITNGNTWGVVSSGESLVMKRAVINSRHGVHLSGKSAKIVNSVVQGSTYGVYGAGNGKYELLQSTLGNITHIGVYLRSGDMVVTNTIVDSARYGVYNANSASNLEHDYNLISADGVSFVNATAGLHEIEKEPIFADPLKGDLHLAAGSPAINAGIDLTGISTTDIEGNQRPSFRQFEIGAYEFTENAGSLRILDWKEQSK